MKLPETITNNLGHLRYGVGSVRANVRRGDKIASRRADLQAVKKAIADLFPNCPKDFLQDGVVVRRDPLGKPYIEWHSAMAEWAEMQGVFAENCHISNTSDGDWHLVFAVYYEHLAGVGVDAVWIPRMELKGKNRDYLLRFARQFMSELEWSGFEPYTHGATENVLRFGVMAHFSLMEAASKACGTGLKIGLGMGRSTSLPMQSLGAAMIIPVVHLLIEGEAILRFFELGVNDSEAYWGLEEDFIISLVLLYKNPVGTNEIGV